MLKQVGASRKIEKKKNRSDPCLPDLSKEINKKIEKKNKKHHPGSISNQNGTGKAKSLRKKNISFRSVPTRPGVENTKKNSRKIQGIKKQHPGLI